MYYEEDNYEADDEDTFPDEDDETTDSDFEERTYDVGPHESRMETFLKDPWPRLTMLLMIIGFVIVIFTPPDLWTIWSYVLFGNYILIIFAGAASVFAIKIWTEGGTSNLRYGGPTNLVVIFLCTIIGTLDTIMWMIFGGPLIPGFQTSVLSLCVTIVLFCIYSLWLIQRVTTQSKD